MEPFNGTETLLNERNWVTNVTILSGDLRGNDGANFANNADNSYHVVSNYSNGINNNAILDGFTIRGGNANGSNEQDKWGGGMQNSVTSPTVRNCVFTGNFASTCGGGMANQVSSVPVVTNCTFSGNSATLGG